MRKLLTKTFPVPQSLIQSSKQSFLIPGCESKTELFRFCNDTTDFKHTIQRVELNRLLILPKLIATRVRWKNAEIGEYLKEDNVQSAIGKVRSHAHSTSITEAVMGSAFLLGSGVQPAFGLKLKSVFKECGIYDMLIIIVCGWGFHTPVASPRIQKDSRSFWYLVAIPDSIGVCSLR